MKKAGGFSLVEVLLALSIFMLLAGGIYAAVSVSIDASSAVAEARVKSERLDGLERLLRETFLALPGASTAEVRRRGEALDLQISPSPAWTLFYRGAGEQGLAFSVRPQVNGRGTFAVANFAVSPSPQRIEAELAAAAWISLLPDLQNVRWRLAGTESGGRLQETWEAGNGRPALINLEFQLADGTPVSWFFKVPAIGVVQGTEAAR